MIKMSKIISVAATTVSLTELVMHPMIEIEKPFGKFKEVDAELNKQ